MSCGLIPGAGSTRRPGEAIASIDGVRRSRRPRGCKEVRVTQESVSHSLAPGSGRSSSQQSRANSMQQPARFDCTRSTERRGHDQRARVPEGGDDIAPVDLPRAVQTKGGRGGRKHFRFRFRRQGSLSRCIANLEVVLCAPLPSFRRAAPDCLYAPLRPRALGGVAFAVGTKGRRRNGVIAARC